MPPKNEETTETPETALRGHMRVALAGLGAAVLLIGIFLLIVTTFSHLAHLHYPSWAAAPQGFWS